MAKFLLQVKVILSDLYFRFSCKNPIGSLEALEKYDLAVIANLLKRLPLKTSFDQFIMNGGKTLWLIDQVAEMDSL
jgi:hypothetical protein